MQLPKKGNRPHGDSKQWRNKVYKSPHFGRKCVLCRINTIFEIRKQYSFCIKCGAYYNRIGTKLLTHDEVKEVSK
ncbi:hypothetical protein LCGC14_1364730 [marine sediment metagenome]|uniref:Ribosomal protein S27a domain-containing protein n=1 Tax=marine sediment metagenome TaxID=412755 RepID=A0A0F9K752_9ZZZZ